MSENSILETELYSVVTNGEQTIASNLSQALRANAFSNRMLIAPRRLSQLAQEECRVFCTFISIRNNAQIVEHGRILALEGLGQSSILGLTSALRETCLFLNDVPKDSIHDLFELVESYSAALLEGYMQGREQELRQEQERTRQAFIRTQQ